MTNINYYVIGGQYAYYCYGGKETLLAAKRLAGQHDEYWDNWQGWHRPAIYRAEDCIEVKSMYNEYQTTMAPKEGTIPVAVYDMERKAWTTTNEVRGDE